MTNEEREEHLKPFREYVKDKIKSYTKEEYDNYFKPSDDSVLSQYQIDYLEFYIRDSDLKITIDLGKSKFW